MEGNPLVTIILTSFNQKLFVNDALESVRTQNYPNIELIIVDNGSSDTSPLIIQEWIAKYKLEFPVKTIFRKESLPYCKSFNDAFSMAKGKYLIDLSGDDMLTSDHIRLAVNKLQDFLGSACCFSDVFLIDEKGKRRTFYRRNFRGKLKQKIRVGDIYRDLVKKHIVSSSSLVFDADLLRKDGGYDEDLSYEDFDIMVRLARKYPFVFSNHIGVNKRIHSKSFAASQYTPRNSVMLPSTLKVCQKIKAMNRSPKENEALLQRVMYETKHALWSSNFDVAEGFLALAEELKVSGKTFMWYKKWCQKRWDFSTIYAVLKKISPQ
ncbi:glycosyltransferase family 2 protein [Aquiflexum sp.]|uniref:glycosyltransferase family 2 protein n=1 Tax=Aquiflexum sp. TaxID=1872584 RepID=UPI00359333E2